MKYSLSHLSKKQLQDFYSKAIPKSYSAQILFKAKEEDEWKPFDDENITLESVPFLINERTDNNIEDMTNLRPLYGFDIELTSKLKLFNGITILLLCYIKRNNINDLAKEFNIKLE